MGIESLVFLTYIFNSYSASLAVSIYKKNAAWFYEFITIANDHIIELEWYICCQYVH